MTSSLFFLKLNLENTVEGVVYIHTEIVFSNSPKMIQLHYQNGFACVFNVEDWEKLRKEHRIIGELLGTTSFLPILPLKLSPEETYFLVEKGFAQLVEFKNLTLPPTDAHREEHQQMKEKLKECLKTEYRESRKRQLESYMDKIVAAKRKKGDNRSEAEIFDEEMNRMPEITDENMIFPNPLKCPDSMRGSPTIVPHDVLLEKTTIKKCKVFADLWEKGYYITSGLKFGGHFLVYKEDPILCHAIHIVRCVEDKEKYVHPTEVVAFGRLANSVKKKAILATVEPNNEVSYITISWPHM